MDEWMEGWGGTLPGIDQPTQIKRRAHNGPCHVVLHHHRLERLRHRSHILFQFVGLSFRQRRKKTRPRL